MEVTRFPTPPINTWQFFHSCRKLFGDAFLQRLFQRSLRQLQRWASDPAFADSHEPNPIDRYEVLLSRLMEIGRDDIARASVARLAEIVDCDLVVPCPNEPDKETIAEECLDDYPALTKFHQAVRDGSQRDEARHLRDMAVREVRETFERFSMGDEAS